MLSARLFQTRPRLRKFTLSATVESVPDMAILKRVIAVERDARYSGGIRI